MRMMSKTQRRSLHLSFFTFLASVLFLAQAAYATSYVTFNDGRLYVFPDSCVQSVIEEDGYISFTALDGSVYAYPMNEIASINEQLSKELPSFASFKFNNKYNYQVFTDATGTIDDDEVNITVVHM